MRKAMYKIVEQIEIKDGRKKLFICITFAIIIFIITIQLLDKAFEYRSNMFDTTEPYLVKDGTTITQDLGYLSDDLQGISIQFGTYQRVNKGTILVALNKDGEPLKQITYKLENIVDNLYQEFYFDKSVKPDGKSYYSISITAKYEGGEDAIAVYTSAGGNSLFVDSYLENDKTLCYQLIFNNHVLRSQMLLICIILFIIVLTLIVLTFDAEHLQLGKNIIVSILILMVLETVVADLLKNINTEVVIVPYSQSDKVRIIEPKETWESKYDAIYSDFSTFLFYVEGEQTIDISIRIVHENTGIEYFNRILNVDEIVTDKIAGKPAISITSSPIDSGNKDFPKGKYNIYFTNISNDKTIEINVIEDASGNQKVNASLIKSTWLGHRLAFLLILAMMFYIAIICIFMNRKKFTVEKFFLISIIPLSFAYLLLMLPWSVPDAGTHYLACYRLSNIMLGNEPWNGRINDVNFFHNIWIWEKNPDMKGFFTIISNVKSSIENVNLTVWPSPQKQMEYYSIFCYLPQVLGLCLGRVMGLGSVITIYLARLSMLIVYVLTCYNAVKKAPIGKFVFASIPLLPMSLMMSSAISYDPLVLIASLNFLALTLKLYQEPKSKAVLLECILWIFLIGAIKGGGYLILLPIVFILFSRKKIKSLAYIGMIIGSGVISAVLFDIVLTSGMELFQFGEEASGKFAATYALSNPLKYIDMCISTYLKYLDSLIINMGGTHLAWLENTIPAVIIIGLILIIGVFSIYENDQIEFINKDKWIFSFVVFLEFFITPVMLLSWTPLGNTVIEGLQGRYYLPVLPLIIMILTKFKLHVGVKGVSTETRIEIQNSCFIIFATLSCISVYYMMRIYLLR